MTELFTRIVLRNDTTANWLANESAVLLKGEVGFEFLTDGKIKMKIGDGVKTWAELDYFSDGDVAALETQVAALQAKDTEIEGNITAINNLIGAVAEGKTVVEMIAEAKAAATYDDTDLVARIAAVEGDYLKLADKTELSKAINSAEENAVDRVLGYLAEEEVNTSYDTLKEVAAWIESDTTNSAQLISRVSAIEADYLKGADKTALQDEIDVLETFVGALPEGATSATVVAYIQEVVDGLKIGEYAKASELTALADRVAALEGKAHEHANSAVLDGITSDKVAAWDAAEQNAKGYADGLNTAMAARVGNVETALEGKVNVEDDKSLVSNALITKLEGIEVGAQANKIESVDEAQFAIDGKKLTLLDIAIGKVTGLQDALDGKANAGTTLAAYGITDAYTKTETEARIQAVLDGLTDTSETAASVSQALETYKAANDQRVDEVEAELATKVTAETGKSLISDTLIAKLGAIEEGAQANKIEAVKVGDSVLEIVEKTVVIPVGAGLKASGEVTIAEDGTIAIGEVNVNKLVQTDGEALILNGGSAK